MRKNNLHSFSLYRRNLLGSESKTAIGGEHFSTLCIKSKPHSGKEQVHSFTR
jgi:hypothetical protein